MQFESPVSVSVVHPKSIPVTIMYHRVTRQVLFLEAGKDFVDLVMGFLTLPLGSILKLLSENALVTPKTVGSIVNVFESIPRLETEEKMSADKKVLMSSKPSGCALGLGLQYMDTENPEPVDPAPKFYYTCTAIPPCSYVSGRSGTKCPRHMRKMTTQCALIDDHDMVESSAAKGYVKTGNRFFVTDNLEIFPSSKSLELLQKLKVENMSFLDSLDIRVGSEEVLQLLRASLTSGSVLSEVFGKALMNNRDTYMLASLREMLSHTDRISSMSYELLRSLERGRRFKEASLADPQHRERRLYSALREIDHAYQARLAGCVGERDRQISSALSGALRDVDLGSSCSFPSELNTSRSSTGSSSQQKEELEKQVDKVVDKLCHLAICAPPPLPPPVTPPNPKPKHPPFPNVKPPWSTSLTTYTPVS